MTEKSLKPLFKTPAAALQVWLKDYRAVPDKGRWESGRGEKLFFTRKKVFPFPPSPPTLFKKSGVWFAPVGCKPTGCYAFRRAICPTGEYNLTHPYSQSEHFTFATGKLFTWQSNSSRRIKSVSSHPLPLYPFQKKRGLVCSRCSQTDWLLRLPSGYLPDKREVPLSRNIPPDGGIFCIERNLVFYSK